MKKIAATTDHTDQTDTIPDKYYPQQLLYLYKKYHDKKAVEWGFPGIITETIQRPCSVCGVDIFFNPPVRSKETGPIIPLNADGIYHSPTHLFIHRTAGEIKKIRQLQYQILDEQTYSELFEELEAIR